MLGPRTTEHISGRLTSLKHWNWNTYTFKHESKKKWAAIWQIQQNECAPSEDSDQSGHPSSLIRVFIVRMKKAWIYRYPLSAQQRLIRLGVWPGWSESLLGAHSFCWFCHVVAQINNVATLYVLYTIFMYNCNCKNSLVQYVNWFPLLKATKCNENRKGMQEKLVYLSWLFGVDRSVCPSRSHCKPCDDSDSLSTPNSHEKFLNSCIPDQDFREPTGTRKCLTLTWGE